MPINPSQDKFECRHCGCRQNYVRQTTVLERKWRNRNITLIKRHRVCRNCGLTFTTVEHQHEDIVTHDIKNYSAMRPIYDYGRAVGAVEFINGVVKPSEEISPPPAPQPQSQRRSGPRRTLIPPDLSVAARQLFESSPTEKPPPQPRKRKR